jgi:hypothetical protein
MIDKSLPKMDAQIARHPRQLESPASQTCQTVDYGSEPPEMGAGWWKQEKAQMC